MGTREPVAFSVVCPFFDEEAVIAEAILGTYRILEKSSDSWEMILVNDGSTDRSAQIAAETIRENGLRRVRLLSFDVNQGRGRALKAGIDHARGDLIVTTEADGSWGDDIAGRLVQELQDHPEVDFVIASPHLPGGGLVNVPVSRVLLTRYGNKLISAFFEPGLTMNTGMTRAYRRHVIQPLVTVEGGKEFHLEVLLKLVTLGFRASEIPATITWPERKARKGAGAPRSSTRIAKTIGTHLRFLSVARPARYFGQVSALAALGSGGFLAAAIAAAAMHQTSVFLALMSALLGVFALLFAGFAVTLILARDILREHWMTSYPGPLPPSARPAEPEPLFDET